MVLCLLLQCDYPWPHLRQEITPCSRWHLSSRGCLITHIQSLSLYRSPTVFPGISSKNYHGSIVLFLTSKDQHIILGSAPPHLPEAFNATFTTTVSGLYKLCRQERICQIERAEDDSPECIDLRSLRCIWELRWHIN